MHSDYFRHTHTHRFALLHLSDVLWSSLEGKVSLIVVRPQKDQWSSIYTAGLQQVRKTASSELPE